MSTASPPTGDLYNDPRALVSHSNEQALVSLHFWVEKVAAHLRAAGDGRVLDASAGLWSYDLERARDEITSAAALLGEAITKVYPPTDDDGEEEKSDDDEEYAPNVQIRCGGGNERRPAAPQVHTAALR